MNVNGPVYVMEAALCPSLCGNYATIEERTVRFVWCVVPVFETINLFFFFLFLNQVNPSLSVPSACIYNVIVLFSDHIHKSLLRHKLFHVT